MIGAFVTCTFGVNAGSVATLLTCTDADTSSRRRKPKR